MLKKYVAAGVVTTFILVGSALACLPEASQPRNLSGNLIRFHVIANSDSQEDQQLKRDVRDAIIEEVGGNFQKNATVQQAREIVNANLEEMEAVAKREISRHGKDYSADAQFGHFDFPAKTYGSFSLPAGNYEAVRIVLGEGKGANWWCVLFPPLCFVDISNSVTTQPRATEVSKDLHSMEEYNQEAHDRKEYQGEKSAVPVEGETVPVIELKFKFLEILDRSRTFMAEWRPKKQSEL